MKNFLLNSIIFVLVVAGTALCVAFVGTDKFTQTTSSTITQQNQNSTEQTGTENNPSESDDLDPNSEVLFGMLENIIKLNNYSGDFNIKSANNKINVLGSIKYINSKNCETVEDFELSKISLVIDLEGKVEGTSFTAKIIYIDNEVFIEYNNLKAYIRSDNLMEILNLVINTIGITTDNMFDLDSLADNLADASILQTESGYKFSITLPTLNMVEIYCNQNYFPTSVNVDNIAVGETPISFNLNSTSTNNITISKPNKSMYIDLNDTVGLVEVFIESAKNLPLAMSGNINFMGQVGHINISISSKFVITMSITYNNLEIYGYANGNSVYLYIMGVKVLTTWGELYNFLANDLKVEFPDNLGIKKITSNEINVGEDINILIGTKNKNITNLTIIFKNLLVELNKTTYVDLSTQPNTSGSLSLDEFKNVIDKFSPLINNLNEFSLNIEASYGANKFSGSAYIDMSPNLTLNNLYLSGKLDSQSFKVYSVSSGIYMHYNSLKLMIDKDNLDQYYNLFKSVLGFEGFNFEELINTLSMQIEKVSVNSTNSITITFIDASYIKLSTHLNGYTVTLSNIKLADKKLNASIKILENSQAYKTKLNDLKVDEYKNIGDTSSLVSSAINTFSNDTNFSGKLTISLFGIKIKNINVSLTTSFTKGKLKLTLKLHNLPTSAFITDLNAVKYKNQHSTITYENGKINVKRYARYRFSNDEKLFVNKTVNANSFSIDHLYLIFGFNNTIMNKISKAEMPSDPTSLLLVDSLENLDSTFALSLKTSEFMKQLSDTKLCINYSDNFIDSLSVNLKFASVISIALNLQAN